MCAHHRRAGGRGGGGGVAASKCGGCGRESGDVGAEGAGNLFRGPERGVQSSFAPRVSTQNAHFFVENSNVDDKHTQTFLPPLFPPPDRRPGPWALGFGFARGSASPPPPPPRDSPGAPLAQPPKGQEGKEGGQEGKEGPDGEGKGTRR